MSNFILIFVLINCVSLIDLNNTSDISRAKRQNVACGVSSKKDVALIINGEEFAKGTWPWMVAMFKKTNAKEEFFCGGTMVSTDKVITGCKVNA